MLRDDFLKPLGMKKGGVLKKNLMILLDMSSVCYNWLVTKFSGLPYWKIAKKTLRGDFLKPLGIKKGGILKKNPGIFIDMNSVLHNWLVTKFSGLPYWKIAKKTLWGYFLKPLGVKKRGILKKNPGILLHMNLVCHNWLITKVSAITIWKKAKKTLWGFFWIPRGEKKAGSFGKPFGSLIGRIQHALIYL